MSNNLEPWVPYMGNKSRLLERLHTTIHQLVLPEFDSFVDLFCGGGSVGYSMACAGKKVIMNDLDTGLISLHRMLKEHPERLGLFSQIEPSKEEFNILKNGQSDYDTFFKYIYSFSTNGKAYLWGEERLNTPKEELNRQRSEPRERIRHLEDVILMYGRYNPEIILENKFYKDVEIPENAIVYCFTPDHEVLTARGWISIKDITQEDWMLSREPGTSRIDWVKNTKCIKRHYTGKMYEYDSSRVSLCVSPEHNLFVKTSRETFIKAADAKTKWFNWLKGGCVWSGGDNQKNFVILGKEYNKILFAELLGLFLTDGSVNVRKAVFLCQKKKKTRDRIRFLLTELNIPFSEYEYGFYIKSPFSRWFWQFYRKENRRVPPDILEESADVLKVLLSGIIQGDGHVEANGRTRIYLGSKTLADNVVEIAYKVGLAANVYERCPTKRRLKDGREICGTKKYYAVNITKSLTATNVKSHERFIDYDGDIYCCTLEKWHTILVRRKGKTVWCGQCDPPYKGTADYCVGAFDHERFYDWCRQCPNIVLISEYEMPDDFFLIEEWDLASQGGGNKNTKIARERLYCNKDIKKLSLF